jgi:hypothetical protein
VRHFLDTTVKRALTALAIGAVITAASWLVVNINLKVDSGRTVTPTVASYFETCHGDSFNVAAPEITLRDRGFPIAFSYQQTIPLCGSDRQTVDRTITETETNWLLAAVNGLLWTIPAFMLLAKTQSQAPESEE